MIDNIFFIILIIICLFLEGFFSGTEMALVSSNKLKIRYLASKGNINAMRLKKILKSPQNFLATTLVGVNLSVITSSAVATMLVSKIFPGESVSLITTVILLPFIIFFGELVPMTIGRTYATRLSLLLITPLLIMQYLLYPLVKFFSFMSEKIVRILRLPLTNKNPFPTREELIYIIEHETGKDLLHKSETETIKKVFNFHKIIAQQIMLPIDKSIYTESSSLCSDVIEIMHKSGFSRIPVYEDELSNVIGIIRSTELLYAELSKPVKKYMVKPFRIPENTPIINILWEMQMNSRQMAIVVNKNKKAVGILTLEDIMEKVVGSITDEYDKKKN